MKNKKIIILFLLCFCIFDAMAQFSILDSLNVELKKWEKKKGVGADTMKVILLNDIGWEVMYSNPDSAILISEKALVISKRVKWEKGIAASYGSLGSYYYLKSDYTKALDYYFRALKSNENSGNRKRAANNLNNIGIIYKEQANYEKALEYYSRALEIQREFGSKNGMANALNNIAGVHSSKGENESALKFYSEAAVFFEEAKNDIGLATSLNNIGVIHEKLGNRAKALEFYSKALVIEKESGNDNGVAMTLGNMGLLQIAMGKHSEAEKNLKTALKMSEQIESLDLMKEANGYLSDLYEEIGRFELALFHYKNHIKLRDSLLNDEKIKEALEQELQFDYEKKKTIDSVANAKEREVKNAEIDKKNAELAQQNTEIKARRTQQILSFIGLGLVLIFAFFMYNRFKVTQKQKSIIEIQKTEVERQREYAEEQQYIAEQQKHLVEEKNKEILDSINYAKRIQEAILPSKDSLVENLKNGFVLYKPKDIVAGDFYWLERVGDMVYFAAADCTGHGVPGALVSVVCSNALTKALLEEEISESGKILDRARELVIEKFSKSGSDVKDGMDISLCRLDIKNLKLQWSGANNPLWIVRNAKNNFANGSPEVLVELLETKPDKQPIGKYAEAKPFTTHNLDLDSGDCIYIFTDGYSDQFGGNDGKKFKAASLKKLLLSLQDRSMDEQKTIIHQTFENWRGSLEQIDDVCIIGVKI